MTAVVLEEGLGEGDDDSLPIVRNVTAGEGRARTPGAEKHKKLATPSAVARQSSAQVLAASMSAGPKRKVVGKRRTRRWNNDHFFGLGSISSHNFPSGEKEEYEMIVAPPTWNSAIADLVENGSQGLRDIVRKGYVPPATCHAHKPTEAKFEKRASAETRFRRLPKRLRELLVKSIRNITLLSIIQGLEVLLESGDSSEIETVISQPVEHFGERIDVWLKDSPFYRLLLHALCQFYELKSFSQDVDEQRVVRIFLPAGDAKEQQPVDVRMSDFLLFRSQGSSVNPTSSS
jgi:hypothetical protein